MNLDTAASVDRLQGQLREGTPRDLELLAADLLGWALDVPVSVSKAGFQHGGDAGTAGQQDRHLRIECKRYADSTPLSERELQGEIDDALRRNPSLEAWILVSTRPVTETTRETLHLHAEAVGVPVIVIDWSTTPEGIPSLAALCAAAPELVERHYGGQAAARAQTLAAVAGLVLPQLRRDLQSWCIGFGSIRSAAARRVDAMWSSDSEARALFAQDVAGGVVSHLVKRSSVFHQLESWWETEPERPAVAFGNEGVGKTWAVVQWVHDVLPRLPITLMLASSAFPELRGISEASVSDFVARELARQAGVRSGEFWRRRLRRLLERPAEDGPVLLMLIDGLNQESSFDWIRLMQVLQGGIFRHKVRVVLTTQTHFLEERLRNFQTLARRPVRIGVEPYDLSPGGEFDTLLAAHNLRREDLAQELIPLARVPRLFPLVMKFRAESALQGDVTVSRLLWAYGRDELGMREGRAFSDTEWEGWLYEMAQKYWDEITAEDGPQTQAPTFSLADLSTSVGLLQSEPKHNYRRLSEIIDHTWMEPVPGAGQRFRPKADTLALALGIALLARLEHVPAGRLEAELSQWLDPIGATSMSADILAAAASIMIARGPARRDIATSVLTALLQSQNVADVHRREVVALAPVIAEPLLDVVECSSLRAQASARQWALTALRGISATNVVVWDGIYARLERWVAHVTCPSLAERARDDGAAEYTSRRLVDRIGTDVPGDVGVLGFSLRVHYPETNDLADEVPRLLQTRPLLPAMRIFVAAAVAAAVPLGSSPVWPGLKWLVLFNCIDHETAVLALVDQASSMLARPPEAHVSAQQGRRVASLLLWLTGDPQQERHAADLGVEEGGWSYERDYLADPAQSYFALEWRHAAQVLSDPRLPFWRRIEKVRRYLPDPKLTLSPEAIDEMERGAASIDVAQLDANRYWTAEDHHFEELEPALARFVPEALAELARRRLGDLACRTGEARHWAALRAPQHLLVAGPREAAAVREARLAQAGAPHKDEAYGHTRLLHLELLQLPPDAQLDVLVEDEQAWLTLALLDGTEPASAEAIDRFLQRRGTDNARAVEVVLNHLAEHGMSISVEAFEQLYPFTQSQASEGPRVVAFMALAESCPERFGVALQASGWRIEPGQSIFEQDRGSVAVLAANRERPLDELRSVVAPWQLLRAAVERGGRVQDMKIAAAALDAALIQPAVTAEVLPADLSVDRSDPNSRISFAAKEDHEMDLAQALDSEFQLQRERSAQERGGAYVDHARTAGASLYAMNIPVQHARMLVATCSAEVDAWLEGLKDASSRFRYRVNLASGLFLAICEALLETQPSHGVKLWRQLDHYLHVRHTGLAGINDLRHMPFRVAESADVLELRAELYSLHCNATDQDYLELVICAMANGAEAWLRRKIAMDAQSPKPWRRKRAILIEGLMDLRSADEASWSEGPVVGSWDGVRLTAQARRNRHAFSRYWFERYMSAPTPEQAYAAWNVLKTCIDRRAWIWMSRVTASHAPRTADDLWRLKMLNFSLNRPALEKAMSGHETKGVEVMRNHLWGWKSPRDWLDLSLVEDADH